MCDFVKRGEQGARRARVGVVRPAVRAVMHRSTRAEQRRFLPWGLRRVLRVALRLLWLVRLLAALRAKRGAKMIDMTDGVDPTQPATFREHGGSLWFRGKGPDRHPDDPARRAITAGGAQ